jgi:imidazolonepropionase-like amidohydrolase
LLPGKVRAKLPVDGNIFTGRIMIRKITRFGSLLPLLCLSQLAMAQGGSYALTNANLFNGVDNRIQENATVLVNDGKIERIAGSNASIPSTYEVIDCEGHFLMPGLFDVHTHINSLAQARRALESGVTTIRTASVPAFQDVSLRELAKAGKIPGPDVAAAGVFVTPNLGETVLADPRLKELAAGVNTDEELRLLVNINADRGVDVIKTRGTQRAGLPDTDPRQQVYTERQLRVIVEEAARHDIPVMVHAHGDEGARAAVLAGARSIEHGTMNEEQYDYVLRLRGKHMVPQLERAVREAHRQGVKIATGADNYYDSKSINRISIEAEQFVRMGMSNFEALQSATVVSAELLQIEDQTGRIAEGSLQDIAALQDVLLVMSNGQVAVKRIPFAKTDL